MNNLRKVPGSIRESGNPKPAKLDAPPQWIRLNQLPSFMWSAIRAMGESVFRPLTRTRLDRIEVVAALGGNGPHTPEQIDAVAHGLRSGSEPANIVEYTSEEIAVIFGTRYAAQAVQYNQNEFTYLLVQDPMGKYIYRWPADDTVHREVRIESPRPTINNSARRRSHWRSEINRLMPAATMKMVAF